MNLLINVVLANFGGGGGGGGGGEEANSRVGKYILKNDNTLRIVSSLLCSWLTNQQTIYLIFTSFHLYLILY